jgi:hypothetical protein
MSEFKEVLYESLLFSFGKILAQYNSFAQESILKDVGKEIIEYLGENGFKFDENGTIDDVSALVTLFVENGFSELEIRKADKGSNYIWKNLYGIKAYDALQKITENPFLSCPLNACIYYLAGKQGKKLVLHSKSFNVEKCSAISQEEFVDDDYESEEGFNSLAIENRRLLKIYEQKNRELKKAMEEIKTLQGLLPICSSCKKIRDEDGNWSQMELYIEKHSDAKFSHGFCEECAKELYGAEGWYRDK